MENHDEQILASEIERDLADVRFINFATIVLFTLNYVL